MRARSRGVVTHLRLTEAGRQVLAQAAQSPGGPSESAAQSPGGPSAKSPGGASAQAPGGASLSSLKEATDKKIQTIPGVLTHAGPSATSGDSGQEDNHVKAIEALDSVSKKQHAAGAPVALLEQVWRETLSELEGVFVSPLTKKQRGQLKPAFMRGGPAG
jgi:hypothetical protein